MDGGSEWTATGELPVVMDGLRGVSMNNKVFITGNIIHSAMISISINSNPGGFNFDNYDLNYQDYILQFNVDNGSWTHVGQLQVTRSDHGASVVNVEDIINYCN